MALTLGFCQVTRCSGSAFRLHRDVHAHHSGCAFPRLNDSSREERSRESSFSRDRWSCGEWVGITERSAFKAAMMAVAAGCTLYFLIESQQFLWIPTHDWAKCPRGSHPNGTQTYWRPEKSSNYRNTLLKHQEMAFLMIFFFSKSDLGCYFGK